MPKIHHNAFQQNGYAKAIPSDRTIKESWIKPIYTGKRRQQKGYPRFHFNVDLEGNARGHVDLKKRHGFLNKWLFGGGKNTTDKDYRLQSETAILKATTLDIMCDEWIAKINKIKKEIRSYI